MKFGWETKALYRKKTGELGCRQSPHKQSYITRAVFRRARDGENYDSQMGTLEPSGRAFSDVRLPMHDSGFR